MPEEASPNGPGDLADKINEMGPPRHSGSFIEARAEVAAEIQRVKENDPHCTQVK